MMEDIAQQSKVEQTDLDDMGQVIRFPNSDERQLIKTGLAIAPQKKGTSPNKGNLATGRTREHFYESEVDLLLAKAKKTGRNTHRNFSIVLMTYRHGLRASEAADLRWTDIDLEQGKILIRRKKRSDDSTHFLQGDELRAIRKLQRESKPSPFVFGGMDSTAISAMIKRLGAGLFSFPVHAHMLRHSCGYYLANKGVDLRIIQEYLGHREIKNTVRYTKLSPNKFKGLWD